MSASNQIMWYRIEHFLFPQILVVWTVSLDYLSRMFFFVIMFEYINFSKHVFKRSSTAKHLTVFGIFRVHLSTRCAEKNLETLLNVLQNTLTPVKYLGFPAIPATLCRKFDESYDRCNSWEFVNCSFNSRKLIFNEMLGNDNKTFRKNCKL